MNAIVTRALCKDYGPKRAVHDLELTVPRGSLFGFIGPNGAGKTTTIRLLMGMLRPSAGSAEVLGSSGWGAKPALHAAIGYLAGDLNLPRWLSCAAAAKMMSMAHGRDLSQSFAALAEQFELPSAVPVKAMSRGMRQKLGIILALAHDPELLILDEPTTALDPLTQALFGEVLRRRAADGATVFFSSHVLSEVAGLCDTVGIIRQGRLVALESIATLRGQAKRLVTLYWHDGMAPADIPPFLIMQHREPGRWSAFLDGSITQFLEWLPREALSDLAIGEPDLDSLFRGYYRERTS
jgi:ABC-2 type transport system ATP-binding protein